MKKLLIFFAIVVIPTAFAANYLTQSGVQHFTVTIPPGSSSNAVTITSVGSLAFLMVNGHNSLLNSTDPSSASPYVTLSNPTTISAVRGQADPTNTVIVSGCVVDASSKLVKSVQRGVTTLTPGLKQVNVPVTDIDSNSYAIFHHGQNMMASTIATSNQWTRVTYTQTNIAVRTMQPVSTNVTTGWVLVEFQTNVLKQAVQQFNVSWFSAGANSTNVPCLFTDTNNSFITWGGVNGSVGSVVTAAARCIRTDTNLTFQNASGLSSFSNVCNVSLVEFKPGVLANPLLSVGGTIVNTNILDVTLGHSFHLNSTFTSYGGQSQSAGAYTTFGRNRLTSPTIMQATRAANSANSTLTRTYIGEFNEGNLLINLFMEGY